MLERLEIKSFQSIRDLSLDLGKFTVIVGKSSVGKSAFIRAARALVFNIRGNMHVMYGEKYSTVTASSPDWIISLERGEGHGVYRIKDISTGKTVRLEKLNKGVPSQVSDLLDIGEIQFADQFDMPFLMNDTGSKVAHVFGELTNVSTIFEARDEGSRRRFRLVSELKTRQADLDEIKIEVEKFKDLPTQAKQLENLEASLEGIQDREIEIGKLSSIISSLEEAQKIIDSVMEYPDVPESVDVTIVSENTKNLSLLIDECTYSLEVLSKVHEYPDPPSYQILLDSYSKWNDVSSLIQDFTDLISEIKIENEAFEEYSLLEARHVESLHEILVENGICPTCQRPI